jgi:hypothetical protein
LPYDIQRTVYLKPVVKKEADCVFFAPPNVPAPSIFWEIYNYRNDLAIRNLLGKTGVIAEQAADRVHSALPVLFVMRENQIPNDPGFLDSPAYRLCVHEWMLRENPNDPYLRLMGLTYSPSDYPKDNAAALEIVETVRGSEGEEQAAKVVRFAVALFLNKYRNMDRMSIMEGLGKVEGLVDPMDVPWARSFFEEGMEKGIEKGREEGMEKGIEKERRNFIRILHHNGISADEIARMAKLSPEYVRHVLSEENGTATDLNGAA